MSYSSQKQKYFLWVLGCQMNKSDGERLEQVLQCMGFSPANSEEEANVVGVVACSVRQTAIDRIHGKIRQWERMKDQRPFVTLLTGCVLPHDREHVAKKFDIFININELQRLPQALARFPGFEIPHEEAINISEYKDYFQIRPSYHERFRAFVPIMSGCDKFCTYCAVPFTRGRERSRSVQSLLEEIAALAAQGCLEVTLLGQNVNSYHPEDVASFSSRNPYQDAFAALLWEINQFVGIERIHFTAPHPKDMSPEVIDALALPKHVNYLHLPMQSGDDEILQKMNRKYTAPEFLNLVEKIRVRKPHIALGTDIIVGFCGETDEQFQHTMELYQAIRYDISYNAMYSPRNGTVAEKLWRDDVLQSEKKRRWKALQILMEGITLQKNQKYKDTFVTVLVDRFEDGFCLGNSEDYKLVRFPGTLALVGRMARVKIIDPQMWVLHGVREEEAAT